MSHINANLVVATAIQNIQKLLPDYWNKTLEQRLSGGAGSCYDQFEIEESLEAALFSADWEETSHPDVAPECRVFKAQLAGRFGLIRIEDVTDDTVFLADDRKGTGKVSLTLAGQRGQLVEETFLIIGPEKNQDGQEIQVCYTFHPGEPILPSKVSTTEIAHGSSVTKAQAVEIGFVWAKLV